MNTNTRLLSHFGILDSLNALRALQGLPKVTDWDFYFAEEARKQEEMDAAHEAYMKAKEKEEMLVASVAF